MDIISRHTEQTNKQTKINLARKVGNQLLKKPNKNETRKKKNTLETDFKLI